MRRIEWTGCARSNRPISAKTPEIAKTETAQAAGRKALETTAARRAQPKTEKRFKNNAKLRQHDHNCQHGSTSIEKSVTLAYARKQ
ncbi:hypothetical protein Sbs19_44860 [Sphingobium sp. BS19]|nr:hypothetical protein Sbs19_44860 [Sphingobium sp. BS19]